MERLAKMQMLLDIIHKAATAGPQFSWTVTEAADELQRMQRPMAPVTTIPSTQTDLDLETEHV